MAFRKSILNSVPVEILREIASSVEASNDKAALCRVSRLLNLVGVPILYRHILLGSVEPTLKCFHTLAKHPKRHDHVRSLRIVIQHYHGDYVPTDIIFPLEEGLRTLRNLENLYLRIPNFNDKYLVIFATLVLPNLRTFSTYHTGTYSPLLFSFLNRHKELTHLDLIRPWSNASGAGTAPTGLPLLHLPRLRSYRGCSVYAALLVVSHRGLMRADIWDAPPATDLDALLSALGDATSPPVPFSLTFLWDGPQTALFGPLAKHIPHTRVLTAGPFMGPHRALNPNAVQDICEALDAFVSLSAFNFDNVEGGGSSRHSIAGDVATLAAWSTRCPTLLTSRLHGRNWSRHSGKWVQVD
ncbi:hypothetical protein B0H14DRAFT_3857156 [Mycena olivaceomarginata]|nr:hypothetical protein B0H14DRAFT_3857156 [Mycena olivaceomarginata]